MRLILKPFLEFNEIKLFKVIKKQLISFSYFFSSTSFIFWKQYKNKFQIFCNFIYSVFFSSFNSINLLSRTDWFVGSFLIKE